MRGGDGLFTCPECDSHHWGTSSCTEDFSEWQGHCHGPRCKFTWHRETDDHKYFSIQPGEVMTNITTDKKYRYRNGEEARVLCVDTGHKYYQVVSVNPRGDTLCHTIEGCYYESDTESQVDLIEISPYDHIKIDDKVLVWDGNDTDRSKRYFAGVDGDGMALTFAFGCTAWSNQKSKHSWDHCEKVED